MQLARRAYVLVLTVKPKSQWDPCGSESVHRMTYLWLSRVKHRFSKVVLRCPEFQLYGHALFILVRHRYSYHCGWIPVYCCHISGRRQEGCSWSETRIHKEVQTLRHLLNALKMSRSSNILSWRMVLFHVSFFFNQMMSLYTNIPWYTVSSSLFLHCAFQCDSLSKRVGKGRRLNQTLLTWIWPQSIPWGSFFFFLPKWDLWVQPDQFATNPRGSWRKAKHRSCLETGFNHHWYNFTGLWFYKRMAKWTELQSSIIGMWIMNGNVARSQLTLSAVESVAPVRPMGEPVNEIFFFPRSWLWRFQFQ